MKTMSVLSLGAGVQSSALALMMARGEIKPVDHAIFADTQGEPRAVIGWLDTLERLIKRASHPFHVHRVTAGNLAQNELRIRTSKQTGKRYMSAKIPAFVKVPGQDRPGLLGRRCTEDYKIVPVTQCMRRLLGMKTVRPGTALVQQAIGISVDEADRMKPSRVPWVNSHWPLVECNITRADCLKWMADHGYPEPPRSACTFCPFHSDAEWLRLKAEDRAAFDDAVAFEQKLQQAARNQEVLNGVPFLHESCKPLDQVVFTANKVKAQMSLFGNECEGLCGT